MVCARVFRIFYYYHHYSFPLSLVSFVPFVILFWCSGSGVLVDGCRKRTPPPTHTHTYTIISTRHSSLIEKNVLCLSSEPPCIRKHMRFKEFYRFLKIFVFFHIVSSLFVCWRLPLGAHFMMFFSFDFFSLSLFASAWLRLSISLHRLSFHFKKVGQKKADKKICVFYTRYVHSTEYGWFSFLFSDGTKRKRWHSWQPTSSFFSFIRSQDAHIKTLPSDGGGDKCREKAHIKENANEKSTVFRWENTQKPFSLCVSRAPRVTSVEHKFTHRQFVCQIKHSSDDVRAWWATLAHSHKMSMKRSGLFGCSIQLLSEKKINI